MNNVQYENPVFRSMTSTGNGTISYDHDKPARATLVGFLITLWCLSCAALLLTTAPAVAQEKIASFSESEVPLKPLIKPTWTTATRLDTELDSLKKQVGWKRLMVHAGLSTGAGGQPQAKWGVAGTTPDGQSFQFAIYDFKNSTNSKQPITMLSIKRGDTVYKAYLKLPEGALTKENLSGVDGMKSLMSALENAEEWFVGANGTVQQAHSFKTCFRHTAFKQCPGFCSASVTVCAAAAAVLAASSAGIGLGAAIGVFAGCAGGLCAVCVAVAALSCIG